MNKGTKILMGITGAALIALGVLCICKPGATLLSASLLIGILTLASGISTIISWSSLKYILPTGNLLLSGILEVVVGIIFLNHNMVLASILPVVFVIWLLVEGIGLAIRSFTFKNFGFRYWWVCLIVGIILAAGGIVGIMYPIDVAGPMLSYIIGAVIIVFGIVEFVALYGVTKLEQFVSPTKPTE